MSEGREERAQATAEERLIWVGNLASEKDSLKQVNAQLQKKLDKQQSVLDSVIAVYTAKAQQAEAEMQKLEEDIRSLELQLSDVKVDRAKIQADLTNQLVRLRTMTAWRDYYRAMAARTILQKLFGSGKVPMPDMPEIAGL
jgi:septal ring factor EnvC (AmiA/AmiB activator)